MSKYQAATGPDRPKPGPSLAQAWPKPGPSLAQARGRARASPGPRGPGLGPGLGRAGVILYFFCRYWIYIWVFSYVSVKEVELAAFYFAVVVGVVVFKRFNRRC